MSLTTGQKKTAEHFKERIENTILSNEDKGNLGFGNWHLGFSNEAFASQSAFVFFWKIEDMEIVLEIFKLLNSKINKAAPVLKDIKDLKEGYIYIEG